MPEQQSEPRTETSRGEATRHGGTRGSPPRSLWLLVIAVTLALGATSLVFLSQSQLSSPLMLPAETVAKVRLGLSTGGTLTPSPVSSSLLPRPTVLDSGQVAVYSSQAAGYAALRLPSLLPPPHVRELSAWSLQTPSMTATPSPPPATTVTPIPGSRL